MKTQRRFATNRLDDVAVRRARSQSNFAWPVLAAGALVAVILVVGIWTQIRSGPGNGSGGPAAALPASPTEVGETCAIMPPDPPFTAPSPYPSSPPDDRYAWFGTPQLWTMLELDGEVWDAGNAAFPVGIKLFWWSSNWAGMREEPEPAITVVATRLDGPGTVTTDHATNAAADSLGGEAMLAGIEFPTAGCWQLTAQYRDALLSYVVWIKDD